MSHRLTAYEIFWSKPSPVRVVLLEHKGGVIESPGPNGMTLCNIRDSRMVIRCSIKSHNMPPLSQPPLSLVYSHHGKLVISRAQSEDKTYHGAS